MESHFRLEQLFSKMKCESNPATLTNLLLLHMRNTVVLHQVYIKSFICPSHSLCYAYAKSLWAACSFPYRLSGPLGSIGHKTFAERPDVLCWFSSTGETRPGSNTAPDTPLTLSSLSMLRGIRDTARI